MTYFHYVLKINISDNHILCPLIIVTYTKIVERGGLREKNTLIFFKHCTKKNSFFIISEKLCFTGLDLRFSWQLLVPILGINSRVTISFSPFPPTILRSWWFWKFLNKKSNSNTRIYTINAKSFNHPNSDISWNSDTFFGLTKCHYYEWPQ